MSSKETLIEAVKSGDSERSGELTKKILAEGVPAGEILQIATGAIKAVGDAFERFEIFLPEMMLAADAMIEIMKVLEPGLKEETAGAGVRPSKIILASVKGDMHEIGKNIVNTLFQANGFDILDMGADVDSLDIIKTAEREKADIIGLSALMTTTMPGQKEVIDLLKDMKLREKFKVIVGGSPTSEEWARSIGADGWGKDASEAVKITEKLLYKKQGDGNGNTAV
jgi:methanogenic corrinoid protein MtbC1